MGSSWKKRSDIDVGAARGNRRHSRLLLRGRGTMALSEYCANGNGSAGQPDDYQRSSRKCAHDEFPSALSQQLTLQSALADAKAKGLDSVLFPSGLASRQRVRHECDAIEWLKIAAPLCASGVCRRSSGVYRWAGVQGVHHDHEGDR